MRAVLAVAVVLAMTGGAVADDFSCNNLPPIDKMQEPTNPYTVRIVSQGALNKACGISGPGIRSACAVPDNMDWKHHATVHWTIYLTSNDDCSLTYEKAHLAPNNWFDASVETHKLW